MGDWGKNGPPYEAIRLDGVLTRCPDARSADEPFYGADMEAFFGAFMDWVHDQGLDYAGIVGGLAGSDDYDP